MQVDLPGVLFDIRGEEIDKIQVKNSLIKLPRTRINVKGNRMVGTGVTYGGRKKTINSSDILANFHSNTSMSQFQLTKAE